MSETTVAQRRLADRLRELRHQAPTGAAVTQRQVAEAIGASVALVSSWEGANAVPPEERLKAYALVFATAASFEGGRGRSPLEADLSDAEEDRRRELIDELIALRDHALRPEGVTGRRTGALGGRFWYFPDGAPVRIITTPMWPSVTSQIPYANRWHPNHIESFLDADRDATIELFGHVRAENPAADVRFLTADRVSNDDLTGHVVLLGQSDQMLLTPASRHPESETAGSALVDYFVHSLGLPFYVRQRTDTDLEYGSEFVVTTDSAGVPRYFALTQTPDHQENYRPRFLRDLASSERPYLEADGFPLLEYDVALLARKPNPLNLSTSVTLCSGLFSRGTYGAVRALTDANLRSRNELFLAEHFGGLDDFWMLFHVPVFRAVGGMQTVTPDLERPFHRLRSSG